MRIPARLAANATRTGTPAFTAWLAELPNTVRDLSGRWQVAVGEVMEPGGERSWVAAVARADEDLVLKVGWRHPEAEHEAEALRCWQGSGAVRLIDAVSTDTTIALLLERVRPGTSLRERPEHEQDEVVAALLRRLWLVPPATAAFRPLRDLCATWAEEAEQMYSRQDVDTDLVARGLSMFRSLPRHSAANVLLCTDLHAQNILRAEREFWLAIDPKPYVGDPAYDVLQHMLNCEQRLATDPVALAHRMAALTDLDPHRVVQRLFARCVQEGARSPGCYAVAERLAPYAA